MSASRHFPRSLAKLRNGGFRTIQSHGFHNRILNATASPVAWTRNSTRVPIAPLTPPSSRGFSTTIPNRHKHLDEPKPGEELWITFIDKDGEQHKLAVCEGDNLLDIAQSHDLEMEGACGGSCACSTCHVIVTDEDYYDKIPEPEDDENDMLDLAFGLTETSRLGCQVKMTKELDGVVVKLPTMTRNLQASDFS
ncbi:hypothetical protein S7711_01463 [Stachybotrys chartarum IBT 7711]|uniref:2Fe-2S ferredoxin-type domain-containing protein n=1 Tax=Stachybotrys chartarum (strain CBS 109288 / IBT 7711) TaxID=1280523 RepID=A0A084B720_STACB|nr:hypothetical protein S7711_01463 [Stachybotrys chartarum IBT 7711]KFA55066.1 hypothetical protein S40293_03516 [Stachybotrys chartarum IBT 40293]KFA77761.1 hypothetical protein S40288_00413 [Stachybotrys chartarum IBT 40288]